MKRFLLILSCITAVSCMSQQIVPLNTSTYTSSTNSYLKDLNNDLDSYTGIWTANLETKQIKLILTKETKIPFQLWNKSFFKDLIRVRYEIKDSNNTILQSTIDKDFTHDITLQIKSTRLTDNNTILHLLFTGGNCNIGIGEIKLKKSGQNKLIWNYNPSTITLNDINCPPNLDYNIYLPITENLLFVKQ